MNKPFFKNMIFVTVVLMDLLAGMEFDLFVPSFPELQMQFNLLPFWVEALLSVNFAGYCLSLFLVGGLADRYGRKPLILYGLIVFIIGTLSCLWAPSYPFLLVGRFLQGLGVAAPAMLSFLIVADTYSLKQQQFLLSIMNGVMNISVGIAPVIGSYVTLFFHWQGNFWALLFLGLITWIMTVFFIPSYAQVKHEETSSQMGYLSIFQSKTVMLIIAVFIFSFVPYWIFVGMSPLLYMESLGVSLSNFGYYQGALALIYGLGSIVFGFIMSRYDQKKMMYLSIPMNMIGLFSIVWITYLDSHDPLLITLAFIPFIIGQIIPSNLLLPICLNLMPEAKGRITAVIHGGRLIFSGLSLQLAGYFYQGSFQNIGIILAGFIFCGVVTLVLVIKNHQITGHLTGGGKNNLVSI